MERLSSYEADRLNDALYGMDKDGVGQTQVSARYVRTDSDGTAWVRFEGADKDTPLTSAMSVTAREGDLIDVRLGGYEAVGGGNRTDPSAGVARVALVENLARDTAEESTRTALAVVSAQQTADEANKVAQATNQHFFADTNGAHITDVTQDEWNAAVADEFSDYDPDTKPYHNQLLNSLGILLRTALNNLVSITRSAIAFYDGTGNAASNIVARFGSDGAQIGAADKSHIELTDKNLNVLDDTGETISYIGSNKTTVDITEYIMKNPASQTYTLSRNYVSGSVTAKDASGAALTVREGNLKRVLITGTISGNYLVVSYTTNDEITCFKFGDTDNAAYGGFSLSESTGSAYADYSHAEGLDTKAYGVASHAQNEGTIAAWRNQTAIGRFNGIDPGEQYVKQSGGGVVNYYDSKYALIIGNGTADNARSNALAVDWTGDVTRGVQFMERRLSANSTVSMSSTYSYTNVPLNTTAASSGTKLEASGNGIKVKEAGYYLISAGLVANAPYYGRVYAGSDTMLTGTSNQAAHVGGGMGVTARYLAANTTIYLKICKTGTTNPTVAGSEMTFLSVIKIG